MLRKNSIPQAQLHQENGYANKKFIPHQPSYYSNKHLNNSCPTLPEQFQQVIAQAQSDVVLYKKRSESQIKGTPKVIILQKTSDKLNAAVQNPSNLLINWLRTQDYGTKFRVLQGVLNCYTELAWVYGHFYIDRQMMKVTSKGQPVSWIHHNFKMNLRQFPIQTSKVSESIFVRKLRSTLSEVVYFPTHMETETVFQLKQLLQFIKNSNSKPPINTNILKIVGKNDLGNKQVQPKQKMGKIFQKNDLKLSKSPPPSFGSLTMNRINSAANINRCKNTGNLQKYYQQCQSQSPTPNSPITPSRYSKPIRMNTEYPGRSTRGNWGDVNPQKRKEERYIPSKSPINKNGKKEDQNKSSEESKNRKLSADYVLLQQWIKTSGKAIDRKFAANSFSTRVTFSSKASKGEIEANTNEIDDSKQRKNDNICLQVETQDNFGNRQRLSANLKQFLRESGIRISRISEQGQIEMQFDSLFQSSNKPTQRNSLKQSLLKKQLQNLFKSECLQIDGFCGHEQELMSELSNILN